MTFAEQFFAVAIGQWNLSQFVTICLRIINVSAICRSQNESCLYSIFVTLRVKRKRSEAEKDCLCHRETDIYKSGHGVVKIVLLVANHITSQGDN